ncbi:MAG: carboxypeptidase-like regulatory domain-containing protein [Anaerolineales bacterium]|jgi:hypothetical protein
MKGTRQRSSQSNTFARWTKLIVILLLVTPVVLAAGCRLRTSATGSLEGHVSIGPLVPVLREGETEPTPSPEMYAQRQVVIYNAGGSRVVERVSIDPAGNYEVELPAGTYTVDINRIGIDSAAGLPTQVEIEAGEPVRLDISIDTGIR